MHVKNDITKFNTTALRDGHQSLAATRMTTGQMLRAAPLLDRLRAKKAAPKTPHLMLLRGQNIVQYTSFPDDVVEAFVKCTAGAGCDILRIFDALNDPQNLKTAIRTTIEAGKHARGEICYTQSPVHTVENFIQYGKELASMGCHSIGIKDMSGILAPNVAETLVKNLKESTGLPVTVHCHDTAGLAGATYCSSVYAGADAIETGIAPFANGTGQPDTARMLALLDGHPRCPTHFDADLLQEIRVILEAIYKELSAFTSPVNERTDPDILAFQVPGGMLSNFRTQLADLGMSDRIADVMKEIPRVRKALGWIPLVTPTSQIVGTQAMLNVKFGPWKNVAQASMDIALGKYGKTPGPIDPEILELSKQKTKSEPITGRLADKLPPGMPKLREEVKTHGMEATDENCVLYAMFPQQLLALHRGEKPKPIEPKKSKSEVSGDARRFKLTIAGKSEIAEVEEIA